MSFFKHSGQDSLAAGIAPQDRGEEPGGPASTSGVVDTPASGHAVPRHTGYASTDLGMTSSGVSAGQHSGYAPTDANGPRVPRSPSGGPGGMAGGGLFHSQGGGHHDNGLHHSGWGPADTRLNDPRPAAVDRHDDDPSPADTGKSAGR